MTVAAVAIALIVFYEASVDGLIDNDKRVASSKKHTQFKTRVQKSGDNNSTWLEILKLKVEGQ